MDIVNTILIILSMLGIIIYPTSSGLSDSKATLNSKTSDELLAEIDELKSKIKELENNSTTIHE